jgi:hypothetical protein
MKRNIARIGFTYGWSFFHKSTAPLVYKKLPGVEKFDDRLLKEFRKKRELRGKNYKPRTKHLEPDGQAKYTNRLFLESSPYLIQHAHNPVNWYP